MKLRSIALLLLLALGLRLGVGPHPCHAMKAMKAAEQPASCHGGQHAPKAPAPGEDDCCKGGHALCEKGCQTAAVLQVDLPAPAVLAFQEQSFSPVDRSLPLFVLSIDHVPLA
ncbi:MAG TPA: hypothetical protein VLB76_02045 [Thermoanaerobaculia bacterium]|jgi:hypothetical protein|nr:hypothetical protein [Thermoanaerobaculia bacterium]